MLFNYLTSDPQVAGIIGWIGLALAIGGFWIAIDQIRKVKAAADAAASAATSIKAHVFSRERLMEVKSAIGNIDNAVARISQERYEVALVFVDFAIAECVQVHQLLEGDEQKKLYKNIIRLRKLGEDLSVSLRDGTEGQTSLPCTLQAREIVGILSEVGAKMRYNYSSEGM